MQTTITLNAATYQRAKALAKEHHTSVDELIVMLIDAMPDGANDSTWNSVPDDKLFNPNEHTSEDLDVRFAEIEKELDEEEGITHEQMMNELKQEFLWLQ